MIYRARQGEEKAYFSGPEYQLVDDKNNRDGRDPKTSSGSIYSVAGQQNTALKPVGQWNSAKIIAHGKQLEHWLNGVKVAEEEIDSKAWMQAIAGKSNSADWADFGKVTSGHIVLQNLGSSAWFRNIRIRKLRDGD